MNTLTTTQELESTRNLLRNEKLPKPALEIMDAATAELEYNAAASHALQPGDIAPDFILPNVDGRSVRLYTELDRGPVVLVFYRGGWCPYCNLELRAYQKHLPEIEALGAKLVAVSPETPDNTLSTSEKNDLSFPVLCDSNGRLSDALGIRFELSPAIRALYQKFGHDLAERNDDDKWALPMPATFVVAKGGVIAHASVDPDYRTRPDPAVAIGILRQLAAKSAA